MTLPGQAHIRTWIRGDRHGLRANVQRIVREVRENPGQTPGFVAIHLGCLLVLFVGAPRDALVVFAATYVLRGLGITLGFHRYFSHRSFKTTRGFQFILAVLGTMCIQRGALWWASHHRRHHKLADYEGDLHSPRVSGFLWAHFGWFLASENADTDWGRIRDFERYPELVWLNEHYLVPPLVLAIGLYLAGGLSWLVWGFFLSTVAVWHVTYSINTIAHLIGTQPFDTGDTSRNNPVLGILALGEGWHNNHHRYMRSARIGFRWWQIDPGYYVLLALAYLGIVWELAPVPEALLGGAAAPAHVPSA